MSCLRNEVSVIFELELGFCFLVVYQHLGIGSAGAAAFLNAFH